MTGGPNDQSAGRGQRLWRGFVDTTGFLGVTGRLLWRHWPTLFAIAFTGIGINYFVRRGAVLASAVHPLLGLAVLMLAPVVLLASYILMLRVMRGSLRSASADPSPGGSILDHLGSVLLPFLAVYSSQGFLDEDINNYRYEVKLDALQARFINIFDPAHGVGAARGLDSARLDTGLSLALVGAIVAAFSLRLLLGRWQFLKRRRWLGIFGAYVEAVWIMLLIIRVRNLPDDAWEWASDRKAAHWVQASRDAIVDRLGSIGKPVDGVISYLWGLLTSTETVILVPLAWLTVGAVVYGRRFTHELAPAVAARRARPSRPSRLPAPVNWLVLRLVGEVRERFGPLIGGIQLLARSSMRPMLLYCLAFLLLAQVTSDRGPLGGAARWMWELERLIIGPQDQGSVWIPASLLLSPLNAGIEAVVLMCLLAAAVDRVLLVQPRRNAHPVRVATPPADGPGAETAEIPSFAQPVAETAEIPVSTFAQPVPVAAGPTWPPTAPPPWPPPGYPVNAPQPVPVPNAYPIAAPQPVPHGYPINAPQPQPYPVAAPVPPGYPVNPPLPAPVPPGYPVAVPRPAPAYPLAPPVAPGYPTATPVPPGYRVAVPQPAPVPQPFQGMPHPPPMAPPPPNWPGPHPPPTPLPPQHWPGPTPPAAPWPGPPPAAPPHPYPPQPPPAPPQAWPPQTPPPQAPS